MEGFVRAASAEDCHAVHEMIVELAVYEKCPDAVKTTATQLQLDMADSCFKIFVYEELGGQVVAFIMCFPRYSTWTGRCLYIEDCFVRPEFRKRGIGRQLFGAVISEARRTGVGRLEWVCLDWNRDALAFYQKLGAESDSSWVNLKLTREAMASMEWADSIVRE